jgi:hypothetical protein
VQTKKGGKRQGRGAEKYQESATSEAVPRLGAAIQGNKIKRLIVERLYTPKNHGISVTS